MANVDSASLQRLSPAISISLRRHRREYKAKSVKVVALIKFSGIVVSFFTGGAFCGAGLGMFVSFYHHLRSLSLRGRESSFILKLVSHIWSEKENCMLISWSQLDHAEINLDEDGLS